MSFLSSIANSTAGNATLLPQNQTLQTAQSGVQGSLADQQALQAQLAAQNGLGNQSQVYNQEGQLGQTLQQQVAGGGPNPAQAALNQNTGANVANQAALMAGQRGAASNPALIARQAALQGANTQQQAVGQAATLQAQQELASEQALQQNNAAQASLAGTQASNQINNQNAITSANLTNQQTQAGLQNVQQQGQNTLNAASQQAGLGAINGAGSAIASLFAKGGMVNYDMGGEIPLQNPGGDPPPEKSGGGGGGAGALLALLAKGGSVENPKLGAVASGDRFPKKINLAPHLDQMATLYHGKSWGDMKYEPQTKMSMGGNVGARLKDGGTVPGKASVQGDSEINDTVKAKLSPGEVVLPRTVTQSDDPVKAAADFMADVMRKKGMGESGPASHKKDFKEALQRAINERKVK